jgi:hypothetical protein
LIFNEDFDIAEDLNLDEDTSDEGDIDGADSDEEADTPLLPAMTTEALQRIPDDDRDPADHEAEHATKHELHDSSDAATDNSSEWEGFSDNDSGWENCSDTDGEPGTDPAETGPQASIESKLEAGPTGTAVDSEADSQASAESGTQPSTWREGAHDFEPDNRSGISYGNCFTAIENDTMDWTECLHCGADEAEAELDAMDLCYD